MPVITQATYAIEALKGGKPHGVIRCGKGTVIASYPSPHAAERDLLNLSGRLLPAALVQALIAQARRTPFEASPAGKLAERAA